MSNWIQPNPSREIWVFLILGTESDNTAAWATMRPSQGGPITYWGVGVGDPESLLVEYLRAYNGAKLTTSLAQKHPDLAEKFGAFDWICSECSRRFGWDVVAPTDSPLCPNYVTQDELSTLTVSGGQK